MAIRLIASDLDGTLFSLDHRPAARTVAAVNAARDAGIHVAAVTGRGWFRGAALATSTGARLHHFLGSNGGHRYDYATEQIDERLCFDHELIRDMMSATTGALGPLGFGFEFPDDLAFDERFLALSPMNLDGELRTAGRMPRRFEGVGKILLTHPEIERVELVNLVEPLIPASVNVTTSGATFVELTPEGADKGSALARLADSLGISAEETIAFGDNQNDLTMLEWAGRGVAMANAHELALGAANEQTLTNEEFGVAVVIESLLNE